MTVDLYSAQNIHGKATCSLCILEQSLCRIKIYIWSSHFAESRYISGVVILPNEEITNSVWQTYSEDTLQEALNNKEAVFIDFTAKWCITCQVNKSMVLNTDEIQVFFKTNNIRLMQADWTNSDPKITKKLAEFGRNSVPLYIYYPAGSDKAQVLPEIITKAMILSLN